MVFSHSFPLLRSNNDTEPLFVLTRHQVTFGNLSVWAFFVISGFLITKSWLRTKSLGVYLRHRILRIYPGFIALAFISLLLIYPIAVDRTAAHKVNLWDFFLQVLRLRIPFTHVFSLNPLPDEMNGSLWSIPYEFWCYLGIAFLGLTSLLKRRLLIIALMLAVIGFHIYLEITGWLPGGKILGEIFGFPLFWATILPFFLAGALMHLYEDRIMLDARLALAALACLVASFFIPHAICLTLPVLGSYLLLWLAYWPPLHPIHLARWGDFSYGTYLYAFPIEQLLVAYFAAHFRATLTPLKLFALALPLSLAAGALSWHLVEKRFLPKRSIKRLSSDAGAFIPTKRAIQNPEPGS